MRCVRDGRDPSTRSTLLRAGGAQDDASRGVIGTLATLTAFANRVHTEVIRYSHVVVDPHVGWECERIRDSGSGGYSSLVGQFEL